MTPTVMFYCQHVLGMGHLVRSREIVKGLDGFDVWFVNGGEPVEGFAFPEHVKVAQLPPIRSDAEFRDIDASAQIKDERRELLLQLHECVAPDVLVLEMFPFGRRKFAFELVPLLEACKAKGTRVVSSVRDILVSKRDQARHEDQACRLLNEYFDSVLVHADPQFQRLEETFLRAHDLRCDIEYTGFVTELFVPPVAPVRDPANTRILVSAGGGRVGFALLSAAIAASSHLSMQHEMEVFTGPYLSDSEYAQLQSLAGTSVRISRYAHDFVTRVGSADLLISMAGYNTCMNILSTGVRALVLPFTGNQNEEQTIRANKLEALGYLTVLREGDTASPERFAAIIGEALMHTVPQQSALDQNGVRNSRNLLQRICQKAAVAHV